MNEYLKRFILLSLFMLTAVSFSDAAISTYKDSNFSQPATEFGDGAKVYFTVSGTGVIGGTTTVTVTSNGTELHTVDVSVYDHGLYYDKTADDGVFSGMFIVTTKLTINPTNIPSPDTPQGLCYKIVPNIHIDKDGTAQISDNGTQTASVTLLTLFNVESRAVADTSVVIFWNTADSGYSRVDYGPTSAYGNSVVKATPTKDLALSHHIPLTGLMPGTLYHYKVSSIDTYGNSHVSGDYTFTTKTRAEVEAAIRAARQDGGLPKTYYVKTDGNDANDGLSITTAWQHPSVAVARAQAGDTICLVEGTWTDEHLVFGSSGIDIAPIVLKTSGDKMSILNGGDKTGIGIRVVDRSYITISDVHLENYYQGVSFESSGNTIREIRMSGFVVENTQGTGVGFTGSSVADISLSDFEISGIGNAGGGDYFALYSFAGGDSRNVEIRNFYVHDTFGLGIQWRNADRVHINNGRVIHTDALTNGDGVGFKQNMYNSIMENIIVDHTGWHGVTVWDYTTGNHPCFNNTIRNCDISYAGHNHVDLHSGAFNTLVENNTLYEDPPDIFNNGILFHNRGSGLILRNNHIYNIAIGCKAGSVASNVPISDIEITGNRIHDCKDYNFYMEASNQKVCHNVFYNDNFRADVRLIGTNILVEDNDIDETATYRIDCGTGVVRNPRDAMYNVRSSYGSFVTLEYTDNTVFKQQNAPRDGTFMTSPVYTPLKSYITLGSSADTFVAAAVTAYPLTARPLSSTATVMVSMFNVTSPIGQYHVVFRASVADNASPMDFTVKSLVPWAWYEVQKDSAVLVAARQLNAAGSLSFRNDTWTGTHTFALKRVPDTIASVISDVKVAGVTATSISVQWATNEPADSRIEYGETAEYGSTTAADTQLVLTHSHEIPGLVRGWYHFRVISRDGEGNETVSGDYSAFVLGGNNPVAVPNPYIKGKSRGNKVVFESLPAGAVVRIYALSGEPVTTIVHDAASGELNEEWDVSDVAGGIYLYTITAGGSTIKGKLGIIK